MLTAGRMRLWSLFLCQPAGPWQLSQPTLARWGVAAGLIKPDELPEGWGLLEVNNRGHVKAVAGLAAYYRGRYDVLREQTDAGDVPLIIPTWREPEADDVDYLHGLVADMPIVLAQMRQLGMQQRVSTYSGGYNPQMIEKAGKGATKVRKG